MSVATPLLVAPVKKQFEHWTKVSPRLSEIVGAPEAVPVAQLERVQPVTSTVMKSLAVLPLNVTELLLPVI